MLIFISLFFQEGENVAKLEKADILELTVRHLHTLRRQNQLATRPEHSYADRFKAGFRHCASEVTNFLSGLDQPTKSHLSTHLSGCIRRLETFSASPAIEEQVISHQLPPNNRNIQHPYQQNLPRPGYYIPTSPRPEVDPNLRRSAPLSSPSSPQRSSSPNSAADSNGEENVWRPW